MWEDKRIPFIGRAWPPEEFLVMLSDPELSIAEFYRGMAYALWIMDGDKDFKSAIDKVKRQRTPSGFPQMEATTPQNEPPEALPRIMPTGKRCGRGAPRSEKQKVKPKTLLYYQHGNNGILMKQRERVNILFRLWNDWGWIDDETEAGDFDRFWEGTPRHCNITWTANSTILTILLQELIAQPYIGKQTSQFANSMVEQQFGKTANSDRKGRLTDDDDEKIRLTLLILDIKNPLPKRRGNDGDDEDDTSEDALREVFAGQLHVAKAV